MRRTVGAAVFFDFTLHRVTLADPIQRRTGRGVILDSEDYSVWPVGYAIRVTESPHYRTGEVIHVAPCGVSGT